MSHVTITADEYRHMAAAKPKAAHKYNAKRAELDGHRFDSQAEARRYAELRLMEREGLVHDIRLQPRFVLQESFKDTTGARYRAIEYRADFQYTETSGCVVVEDVKGVDTPVWKLKEKLFRKRYPQVELRVIRNGKPKTEEKR